MNATSMRAQFWMFAACGLGGLGCGMISGLDQLVVDASTPAQDGGDAAPADADAATDRDVPDGPTDAPISNVSIQCGQNLVCTGGQLCCLSLQSSGTYACAAQCPPNTRVLKCDDRNDCSGSTTVCCGTLNDAGDLLSASCSQLCSGVALCDPLSANECAPNTTCGGNAPFGSETLHFCK